MFQRKYCLYFLFFLILIYNLPLSLTLKKKQPLYVLVTGPYPDPLPNTGWDAGISLIPAVRLAFEQINNKADILSGYELKLIERDSGCRSENSIPLKVFTSVVGGTYYSHLQESCSLQTVGQNIIGIIGPACSDAALAIAPFLERSEVNILQLSPTATSPQIERANFGTTVTMISSSLAYIESIAKLMECNEWSKVAVIFDGLGANFQTTAKEFDKHLPENITFSSPAYMFNHDDFIPHLLFPFDELIDKRARVIVIFAGKGLVQRILCLAYKMNAVYPQYQWIFSERSPQDFKENVSQFKYNGIVYNCSQEEMEKAANGSILNQYSLILDEGNISVTSQNYSTYRDKYDQFFKLHSMEPKVQEILRVKEKGIEDYMPSGSWENTYYDAGLTLGLALDQLAKDGHNLSYETRKSNFTQLLLSRLLDLSFTGATGPVKFNKEAKSVQTTILLSQLNLMESNGLSEALLTKYDTNRMLQCPQYEFINHAFEEFPIKIHNSLAIIILIIVIFLTALVALLQITFMLSSNHRSIKAVSPNLTYLIFSGCYLFSLATIVHTVQEAFLMRFNVVYPVLCSAVMWCLMIGSSLIFGTIFVRVWRVFRLFKHFRNKSPGILLNDNVLICGVVFFIIVDVVVCIFWVVYSPWMLVQNIQTVQNSPVVLIRSSCSCEGVEYWIAGVATYKGGIALLLVIFSVLNRKIQRKHFSHTKKINILVYSLTVLAGIGFPMYFLLKDINIYLPYFIICAFFLATIMLCCSLIFVPPVMPVLKAKLDIKEEEKIGRHLKRKFSTISIISRDSELDTSY